MSGYGDPPRFGAAPPLPPPVLATYRSPWAQLNYPDQTYLRDLAARPHGQALAASAHRGRALVAAVLAAKAAGEPSPLGPDEGELAAVLPFRRPA